MLVWGGGGGGRGGERCRSPVYFCIFVVIWEGIIQDAEPVIMLTPFDTGGHDNPTPNMMAPKMFLTIVLKRLGGGS